MYFVHMVVLAPIWQVNHPDLKYKKMGLIGTLKVVSCLADVTKVSGTSFEVTCLTSS